MTVPIGVARAKALALLDARDTSATLCPSEVARALSQGLDRGDWRALMPVVHLAVDQLLAEGRVTLSWKGKPLHGRAGPYRIGRRVDGEVPSPASD